MKFFDGKLHSNPGSRIKIEYQLCFDDFGRGELKESGKMNLYEFIQSFAESCDMNAVVRRIAQGDLSDLRRNEGMFGDFVDMPRTYSEFLNLQIKSKNLFDSLPVEIREKFGFDANRFLAQSGTKEFFDSVKEVLSPVAIDSLTKAGVFQSVEKKDEVIPDEP